MMGNLVVLLCVLVAATAAGCLLRARAGRVRQVEPVAATAAALASLGVTPGGQPVTLVQFSSAFCAPCRATRVLLGDLARRLDGVRHVEVDAESRLEAVRALGIMRTPTTLIVDSAGQVVGRVAGVPRRAELVEAVRSLADGVSCRETA
jgi:thiol-disulfide isomerase/thioredoxin